MAANLCIWAVWGVRVGEGRTISPLHHKAGTRGASGDLEGCWKHPAPGPGWHWQAEKKCTLQPMSLQPPDKALNNNASLNHSSPAAHSTNKPMSSIV
eukprot:21876-Pelagomonas_calceolata.AAC.1